MSHLDSLSDSLPRYRQFRAARDRDAANCGTSIRVQIPFVSGALVPLMHSQ